MSIPSRLINYLEQRGARYDVLPHRHSHSSEQTAHMAHIPPQRLAKSVMVEDDAGCVMAVLPAHHHVQLGRLARMLGRAQLRLADEARIAPLLADCERGALPATGMAWGIETVVDEALENGNELVYFEAGDHENLICLTREQFRLLMLGSRHGQFSAPPTH